MNVKAADFQSGGKPIMIAGQVSLTIKTESQICMGKSLLSWYLTDKPTAYFKYL